MAVFLQIPAHAPTRSERALPTREDRHRVGLGSGRGERRHLRQVKEHDCSSACNRFALSMERVLRQADGHAGRPRTNHSSLGK